MSFFCLNSFLLNSWCDFLQSIILVFFVFVFLKDTKTKRDICKRRYACSLEIWLDTIPKHNRHLMKAKRLKRYRKRSFKDEENRPNKTPCTKNGYILQELSPLSWVIINILSLFRTIIFIFVVMDVFIDTAFRSRTLWSLSGVHCLDKMENLVVRVLFCPCARSYCSFLLNQCTTIPSRDWTYDSHKCLPIVYIDCDTANKWYSRNKIAE